MAIALYGTTNLTALVVPNLLVTVVPPSVVSLNGVPTNIVGVVGTASWGPINQAQIFSGSADYLQIFGAIQPRKFDMGTQAATAIQQGTNNFRGVRVSDGTDTAASGGFGNALTFYARYTGSKGNAIQAQILPGSRAGTYRLSLTIPGSPPEVYSGISGADNPTLWQSAADAVNLGAGVTRGPSAIVVAVVGSDTSPAFAGSVFLSGGTDGENPTSAQLVGNDTSPATGLYALANTGISIVMVADLDDSTFWTTVDGYALSQGWYAIQTGPASDSVLNAVATKYAAGFDSTASKLMMGDWIYWNDPVNGVLRLVSPQGFVAGRLANLSPEQSSLNKPLYGIVGSERSGTATVGQIATYSDAELEALIEAGIDMITNPIPAGNIWGVRSGKNASTDPTVQGDNYTRLTNYIAATLNSGMGRYIGQIINNSTLNAIRSTLLNFLANMLGQGLLSLQLDNTLPYSVVCDATNNPFTRTSLGYAQADAKVQYGPILLFLNVNLQAGQTVVVTQQPAPLAA